MAFSRRSPLLIASILVAGFAPIPAVVAAAPGCDDGRDCTWDTYDVASGTCRHELDLAPACEPEWGPLFLAPAFDVRSHADGDGFGQQLAAGGGRLFVLRLDFREPPSIDAFDTRSGRREWTLQADPAGDPDDFREIASAGGHLLVTAAGEVAVHDGATGRRLRVLRDPTPGAGNFGSTLHGTADRALVRDGTAFHVFDLTTGTLLHTLTPADPDRVGFGRAVVVHEGLILIGSVGALYGFDLATGAARWVVTDPTPATGEFGARVAAVGRVIIVGGSGEGALRRYDIDGNGPLGSIPDPEPINDFFGLELAVVGTDVAVGRFGDRVHVFDPETGALRRTVFDPFPSTGGCFGLGIGALGPDVVVTDPCFGPGPATGDDDVGIGYVFSGLDGTLRFVLRHRGRDDRDFLFSPWLAADGAIFARASDFSAGRVVAFRPPVDRNGCAPCEHRGDSGACVAVPQPGCTPPGTVRTSTLRIDAGGRERLRWNWRGDAAGGAPPLSEATTAGDYAVCVFTGDRLALALPGVHSDACRGRPCTEPTARGGIRLRAPGPGRLTLVGRASGRVRISVGARAHGLTLPLTAPVHVQLHGPAGTCWEARYAAGGRNDAVRFRATPAVN